MDGTLRILMHAKVFYPSVGGLERVTHTLAANLWAKGVEVQVLTDTPSDGGPDPGDYPVLRRPSAAERRRLVRQCDLIHVNGFSLQLLPDALRYRKPIIWRHSGHQASCLEGNGWHAGRFCEHRWWRCGWLAYREHGLGFVVRRLPNLGIRRLALRLAARNICVTQWVAERIRAPRTTVIWNPVEIAAFVPGERGVAGHFTFVGRLAAEKGCDVLLRALQVCRQRGREFEADVYGDGPERPKLLALAEQLGLPRAVRFHGTARGSQLPAAIGRAWAVVVPSPCEEALGIVAVEAMAAGKPLIVSRRGGLAEVSQGCSLSFANGDHDELADRMMQLADDPPLYEGLAASGPDRARLFAPERIVERYLAVYREVLSGSCV